MEKPNDVSRVQRLIGMVRYLGNFLSSLSDICESLRRLTHKYAVWNWNSEHDEAFQSIKNAVTKAPVLKFFDSNMQVEGQGDASSKSLGFVLLQDGRPFTYTSRALTSAERKYSQIEKELLAQVFGMEQNHQYVYGREITLWTDHQPLVSIATSHLPPHQRGYNAYSCDFKAMMSKFATSLAKKWTLPTRFQGPTFDLKMMIAQKPKKTLKLSTWLAI